MCKIFSFFLVGFFTFFLLLNPRYLLAQSHITHKDTKYFDLDHNGVLNRYEQALLNTHQLFGYPIITKKKQMPYDFNNDCMLQPYEMQSYLKDKENGTLKKVRVVKNEKQKIYDQNHDHILQDDEWQLYQKGKKSLWK